MNDSSFTAPGTSANWTIQDWHSSNDNDATSLKSFFVFSREPECLFPYILNEISATLDVCMWRCWSQLSYPKNIMLNSPGVRSCYSRLLFHSYCFVWRDTNTLPHPGTDIQSHSSHMTYCSTTALEQIKSFTDKKAVSLFFKNVL